MSATFITTPLWPQRRGSCARPRGGMFFDEVQLPKWPAAARIAFMVSASILLWIGIAAMLGLIG